MTDNLYYDLNGERWTILDFHSKITFSSERGLKQAISRKKSQRTWKNGKLAKIFWSRF